MQDKRVVSSIDRCNLLIAEEKKSALRLLAACNARGKEILLLNEHSTDADRMEVYNSATEAKHVCFVSDTGTPCIADPDYKFIDLCIKGGFKISSVGSTSSLTGALSISGFDCSSFCYLGFPPKSGKSRHLFFQQIKSNNKTAIFMERPYSLKQTLNDMVNLNRSVALCCNLGGGSHLGEADEFMLRGKPKEILKALPDTKCAFTVVINKK